MTLQAFRIEFERYRRLADGAIAQVTEEQLRKVHGEDGNSMAVILGHLSGNLRSRFTDFLTTDGEKPWRTRDREFLDPGLPREELLQLWSEAWSLLEELLASLTQDHLEQVVTIRAQELSVAEALARSSAHVAYHVGQLVLLARMQVGRDWKSLSIPRDESQAYNQHPTLEK